MAKLEVEIGAKVDELKKALRDSQKKVSDFTAKVKKQTSELAKNNTQLAKTEKQLEKLNADYKKGAIDVTTYSKSVNTLEATQKNLSTNSAKLVSDLQKTNTSVKSLANQSMPQLGKSTANAVPAVTELSRVIQDAPFGIQGVGNNIQQLTAVFGNLVTKTGGTTSALKAMLGALSGPAGILFAVSVVTSALTAFGTSLFSASKKSDKLKDSTKDTNEELKSQGEILKDLIKEYDDFGKIRTKSIFNITKEKESVKALFSVLTDELSTIAEKQRAYSELEKTYSNYLKGVDSNNISQVLKAEKALTEQLEIREKRLQTLIRLEETARNIQLKRVEIENLLDDPKNQKKIAALGDEIFKLRELQKELREALSLYTALDTSIGETPEPQRPVSQTLDTNLQATGLQNIDLSIPEAVLQRPINQISELQLRMMEALMAFNAQMDNIIRNNIANTFAGIGQAIGNALASGANLGDELGKVLLSAIGSVLTQLGQLAITIGVTLLKIEASLKNLKGGIAIAAGVAAIALGSVFKSGAAKIGGNFSGGVGGGGSTGARSFTGGGFTGAQPFSGNLTFTIRGNDLVAVLNNAIDQTAIFGGNVTVSNG